MMTSMVIFIIIKIHNKWDQNKMKLRISNENTSVIYVRVNTFLPIQRLEAKTSKHKLPHRSLNADSISETFLLYNFPSIFFSWAAQLPVVCMSLQKWLISTVMEEFPPHSPAAKPAFQTIFWDETCPHW